MYTTVTEQYFIDAFNHYTGGIPNFTLEARRALFAHLTRDEDEDQPETIKAFDPVTICCRFTEFENLAEYNENYSPTVTSIMDVAARFYIIEIPNSEAFIIDTDPNGKGE